MAILKNPPSEALRKLWEGARVCPRGSGLTKVATRPQRFAKHMHKFAPHLEFLIVQLIPNAFLHMNMEVGKTCIGRGSINCMKMQLKARTSELREPHSFNTTCFDCVS